MKNKIVKVGSDFSGVGAFNQALKRININYEEVFACDMDKYARKTFVQNYGEPSYYPENVYDRQIPTEPLDIYMTSPPCQAFSLAGKRKGEEDKRGVLFYNSHEFILKNKPRYFIFENVKGLLSDDGGKTFQRWIDYLGGKSVNGTQTMFPDENAVPYHVYYQVLNAKDYGVPQNRERIFIIGIRDDADNNFTFPKPFPLTKRLKDVLEENVDEKYYLSEKGIEHVYKKEGVYTGINEDPVRCLTTRYSASIAGTFLKVKSATSKGYEIAKVGEDSINFEHPNSKTRRGRVGVGVGQTLTTSCNQGVAEIIQYDIRQKVKVRKSDVDIIGLQKLLKSHKKTSIKKIAEAINRPKTEVEHWFRTDKCFSIPDAEIWFRLKSLLSIYTNEFDSQITEFIEKDNEFESANRIYDERGISPTLTCSDADKKIITSDYKIGAIRGRKPENPTSRQSGLPTQQMLEVNENGTSNCLTTVQKDNVVIEPIIQRIGNYSKSNHNASSIVDNRGISPTVMENHGTVTAVNTFDYRIRKLTPRECFRLMDFPDTFDFSVVSDSQAYKQAGNSIVVNVLTQIISKFNIFYFVD